MPGKYTGRLYLIRHTQASFGHEIYDRLSEKGIRQANILADHFLDSDVSFDAVYSGTMERQILTASIIRDRFSGLHSFPEIIENNSFNEFDGENIFRSYLPVVMQKEPEKVTDASALLSDRKAFQRVFEKIISLWISGENNMPEIETWRDFKTRVEKGLEKIMKTWPEQKNIALFTSGGVIATVLKMATGLDDKAAIKKSWQCLNGSVSIFSFGKNTLKLHEYNNAKHFEATGEQGLLTYR